MTLKNEVRIKKTTYSKQDPHVYANSYTIHDLLKQKFNPYVEEIWGIYLNNYLELIDIQMIHRGTVDHCQFHPRDLFRPALHLNASAIILAHNHPSLNLDPSEADFKMTKKIVKAGKLLQLPILDHIIFLPDQFFSFRDHQIL